MGGVGTDSITSPIICIDLFQKISLQIQYRLFITFMLLSSLFVFSFFNTPLFWLHTVRPCYITFSPSPILLAPCYRLRGRLSTVTIMAERERKLIEHFLPLVHQSLTWPASRFPPSDYLQISILESFSYFQPTRLPDCVHPFSISMLDI